MSQLQIHHLRFSEDLAVAHTLDGEALRFSKHERALLRYFTRRPFEVLSRDAILDAITQAGGDTLDRNIDYLISRLRKKLGDEVARPRFIATVYGEGYRWTARVVPAEEHAEDDMALLRIQPTLTGVSVDNRNRLQRYLSELHTVIANSFDTRAAVLLADVDGPAEHQQQSVFVLDCSVLQTGADLRCSITLRDGQCAHIYECWRQLLTFSAVHATVEDLGQSIYRRILTAGLERPALMTGESEPPLGISISEATKLFSSESLAHREANQILRQKLAQNPDDHFAAITLASSLHATLVLNDVADIPAVLEEIESLITPHIASLQQHPVYLSASAKLMFYLGHSQLGEQLAERALDLNPCHPAVLMVYGSIQGYQGNLQEALTYYQFALERCKAGSQFRAMIQVLKANATRALGDMEETARLVEQIVARDESVRLLMNCCLLGDDERMDPQLLPVAAQLAPEHWQLLIRKAFHVVAKQFATEALRARALEGVLKLAFDHVGSACLIDELRQSTPALYQRYSEAGGTAKLTAQRR